MKSKIETPSPLLELIYGGPISDIIRVIYSSRTQCNCAKSGHGQNKLQLTTTTASCPPLSVPFQVYHSPIESQNHSSTHLKYDDELHKGQRETKERRYKNFPFKLLWGPFPAAKRKQAHPIQYWP